MTKDEIFTMLKAEIINNLPKVREEDIKIKAKLSDLGANSIDRTEITINCMRTLEIKIEPLVLAKIKNIGDLVDTLFLTVSSK